MVKKKNFVIWKTHDSLEPISWRAGFVEKNFKPIKSPSMDSLPCASHFCAHLNESERYAHGSDCAKCKHINFFVCCWRGIQLLFSFMQKIYCIETVNNFTCKIKIYILVYCCWIYIYMLFFFFFRFYSWFSFVRFVYCSGCNFCEKGRLWNWIGCQFVCYN